MAKHYIYAEVPELFVVYFSHLHKLLSYHGKDGQALPDLANDLLKRGDFFQYGTNTCAYISNIKLSDSYFCQLSQKLLKTPPLPIYFLEKHIKYTKRVQSSSPINTTFTLEIHTESNTGKITVLRKNLTEKGTSDCCFVN